MQRREFIAGLSTAAAWPAMALAQTERRVGLLMNVLKDDPGGLADVVAFRRGLAELGWFEGRNIQIEFRWPGGDIERVEASAKELVGLKPDVLLARSTPITAALKREAGNIPIVFVNIVADRAGICAEPRAAGGKYYGLYQF